MKSQIALALLLALFTINPANAVDGNTLLKYCKEGIEASQNNNKLSFGAGYCIGLTRGSIDTASGLNALAKDFAFGKQKYFCVPENVTNLQAIRVLVKHLEESPKYLHYNDTALVVDALHENFSCN